MVSDKQEVTGRSNLGGGGPDILGVVMKGGQEGMSRRGGGRGRGSRVIGSTHVCGPVSGVVPDVVHQRGQVLQAVGDVVRKEQDAHRLKVNQQIRFVSQEPRLVHVFDTLPAATSRCRGCAYAAWSPRRLSGSQQSSLA